MLLKLASLFIFGGNMGVVRYSEPGRILANPTQNIYFNQSILTIQHSYTCNNIFTIVLFPVKQFKCPFHPENDENTSSKEAPDILVNLVEPGESSWR